MICGGITRGYSVQCGACSRSWIEWAYDGIPFTAASAARRFRERGWSKTEGGWRCAYCVWPTRVSKSEMNKLT